MLNSDVFSGTTSFGLETKRTASSDIDDLKKIKTLKKLKEVFIFFFSVKLEMHQ